MAKRLFDIVCSILGLIILSPVYLIIYIGLKFSTKGPAIFVQERIGKGGRPFNIYKFRTMIVNNEQNGIPQLAEANDDRLTPFGRFLRAHHLDELPQLWNVLKGDMSFIGPRPERKYFIDQIMERDPRYEELYKIRPGLTSYATLYNGYTDTMEKMLRRLELDLYYLEHRSWWFDLKIICKTFLNILFGKKF
ncbi:MAG: sugar transferase [Prevotella sp.]|nr:sugar transferase [Prevotella sp.]